MVRRASIPVLTLAVLAAFAAGPARAADPELCEQRLARLAPKADTIHDTRARQLYDFDIKSAHRELLEGDESECREILDHAETLLTAAN